MSAPPLPEVFGNYALGEFVEVTPPDAISWLPQTVGWLWLGVGLLAILSHFGWKRLRLWYHNRYRREGAAQLQQLGDSLHDGAVVSEVNRSLKLVALAAYSRERVAKLSGDSWLHFLKNECTSPVFNEAQLDLLAYGSYKSTRIDRADAAALIEASVNWVMLHRGSTYA